MTGRTRIYTPAYQSLGSVTPGVLKGLNKNQQTFTEWEGVCSATLSAEIALVCVAKSAFVIGSASLIDLMFVAH